MVAETSALIIMKFIRKFFNDQELEECYQYHVNNTSDDLSAELFSLSAELYLLKIRNEYGDKIVTSSPDNPQGIDIGSTCDKFINCLRNIRNY